MDASSITIKELLPTTIGDGGIDCTYVGIDFGTSTTVASIAGFDKANNRIFVQPIRIPQLLSEGSRFESEKVPSAMAWFENRLLVGEGANELKYQMEKGRNIWYSFKMEIGEDLGAKYYNSELTGNPVKIVEPKDCVYIFFTYLTNQIKNICQENGLSSSIKYAISIPASFEANQRKDLLEALADNNINVDEQALIDEPNAAFLSYVFETQNGEKPLLISPFKNSKVLVFDFGGGTCDISILEIGKNASGFYSKNVAISKFTQLGGDDIDRYLAEKYLYPRLLEYNDFKGDPFRTKERNEIILQLLKIAERIKVLICRDLAAKLYKLEVPKHYKLRNDKVGINADFEYLTSHGKLRQSEFFVTYKEMTDAMDLFTSTKTTLKSSGPKSIYEPIKNALGKCNINKDDIDYVLLIGGSAQNPYIQEAINNYFNASQILVPQDLQCHVSQGTALHSFLFHGLKTSVIKPITSETIFIILQGNQLSPLFPAGTLIPSPEIEINGLTTTRNGQRDIEIPICIGNENKILFVLKVSAPFANGFPVDTPVKLIANLDNNKMLHLKALCLGAECETAISNPFSNRELTTEERLVLTAERAANNSALSNNGKVSRQCLKDLIEVYERANQTFLAAETAEQLYAEYPGSISPNNIALKYSSCFKRDKAIDWYREAYKKEPNDAVINFNLGYSLHLIGDKEAKSYIERALELNTKHSPALITLADIIETEGDKVKAEELRQRAFEIYMERKISGNLRSWDYSWFSSLARQMGQADLAFELSHRDNSSPSKVYDENNLLKTSQHCLPGSNVKEIEQLQ